MKCRSFKVLMSVIVSLLGLSGCMTVKEMPLRSDVTQLDMKTESIVLFSARIMNDVYHRYQPKIITAVIVPEGAKEYSQWLSFKPQAPYAESDIGVKEYLLSANLAPGKYKIKEIRCMASAFPFNGLCELPMNAEVKIDQPGQMLYLGHVNATIRERKENEMRAGPVIPLIDQAATGMSGGSFDVVFEDRYETDTERYRKTYSAIQNSSIQKAVFPAWVRPMDTPLAKQ